MAQLEIDFGDAARLESHLLKCGLSPVQAGLAALVFRLGGKSGELRMALQISSRRAAAELGCSDRAVAKAAATLQTTGWFWAIDCGQRKPPRYVLDVVAARSLSVDPLEDWGPPDVVVCEPVRTTAHQVRTSPRVLPVPGFIKPVSSSHLPFQGEAAVRTSAQRFALPWSRRDGVQDAHLVAAVRGCDVDLLRYLFDVATAPPLEWIQPGTDSQWHDFLTACHHAATARLSRRMGRLVSFLKHRLDVSRCRQASDEWAGRVAGQRWRDPSLARRMCAD